MHNTLTYFGGSPETKILKIVKKIYFLNETITGHSWQYEKTYPQNVVILKSFKFMFTLFNFLINRFNSKILKEYFDC